MSPWDVVMHFAHLMMVRRGYRKAETVDDTTSMYTHEVKTPVLLHTINSEKMNIESVKEFVNMLHAHNATHGVVIYQSVITASTKKVLDNLFQFRIELFEMKEFRYDLTKLRFFCTHDLVPKEEAVRLLRKFGQGHLPALLRTDPVVRYYGFVRGDLLKVTRRDGTIAYRVIR